jgi:hypothetical protein
LITDKSPAELCDLSNKRSPVQRRTARALASSSAVQSLQIGSAGRTEAKLRSSGRARIIASKSKGQ